MLILYDIGDAIRISSVFLVGAEERDPTTVTLSIKHPAGVVTDYTYAGSTVIKDAVGKYHKDIIIDNNGEGFWHYRWIGTGTCTAAGEGQFYVRKAEAL